MRARVQRLSARRALSTAVAAVFVVGHGCGGGGSFVGPLVLTDVNAESLGALPVSDGYLDSRIVFAFSKDVDPTSVRRQAMRVVLDSDPTTPARGDLRAFGHDVVFVPDLPIRADLADAAYDVGANVVYRVEVDAGPPGPRGRDGSMLETPYRSTFGVRIQPPLFSDRHPGPPRVIGMLVDLDGDGLLEGDGRCRAARQPRAVSRCERGGICVVRRARRSLRPRDDPARFERARRLDPSTVHRRVSLLGTALALLGARRDRERRFDRDEFSRLGPHEPRGHGWRRAAGL
ncbi:MAG: hypothetical protein HYR85_24930 [Planctomycetes bacterium]|nr:hypothetical protein [Planctomycetota bacterium]MBI3844071.1 hypothetical protein [Planctomycetota bacterium]